MILVKLILDHHHLTFCSGLPDYIDVVSPFIKSLIHFMIFSTGDVHGRLRIKEQSNKNLHIARPKNTKNSSLFLAALINCLSS